MRIPPEDIPAICKCEMRERMSEIHFIPSDVADAKAAGVGPYVNSAKQALDILFDDRDGEVVVVVVVVGQHELSRNI